MNATSFSFGLLIVLFTILLLRGMHKLKLLEGGKSLTSVSVTLILENKPLIAHKPFSRRTEGSEKL